MRERHADRVEKVDRVERTQPATLTVTIAARRRSMRFSAIGPPSSAHPPDALLTRHHKAALRCYGINELSSVAHTPEFPQFPVASLIDLPEFPGERAETPSNQ
jgi:hypothetical protein